MFFVRVNKFSAISKLRKLTNSSIRLFSSAEGEQEVNKMKEEFENISEEEKQKYRDAWGLKFNDECIKFEKEWEKIAIEQEDKQRKALDENLDEYQKRKIEFLADKVCKLSIHEVRYLALVIGDSVKKTTGISPMKLNMDWPSLKMDTDGTWPPLNPNWFKQQEMMAQIAPFIGGGNVGLGGGGGQAASGGASKTEEVKEQPVKANYDVELTSYDTKGKIKLIKELRAILNLGLKEAKEMVEGVPVWVKKEMKKEDAEELVAKLEPLGATMRLV
jgi:large subunit ribosomal protein L7/L12